MKKVDLSFQSRLYLYILLVVILIFGSIAIVFQSYSKLREEEQAALYTFALQNTTIQNLEDELEWMESSVELTIKQVMSTPVENHQKAVEFIGQLVKNNSLILGVGYISYDDEKTHHSSLDYVYEDSIGAIHHNHIPREQYNYKKTQWYHNAVKAGKGEWTEPYMDSAGSHKMIASYALPVKDADNKLKGVVVADVALVDLTDELNTVQPFENSYSFILSRKGTVIAHPDTRFIMKDNIFTMGDKLHDEDYATIGRKMLAGQKGSLRCDLDGTDVLVCYAPLGHVGWSVASVCPYSAIVSELGSVTFVILGILVLGMLLLAVCIHFLLEHMVKPIRQMTDNAYRIAQGDFDASLPDVRTNDDFGKLHDAFAHMQKSVKTYIHDLESATQARERIHSELSVASRIQTEILPTDFVLPQGYENIDIDGYLIPARQVGGDFYYFWKKDGKLYFTIGDVSGKGIAAAIVMAMTCTLFRSLVSKHDSPSEIMMLLNEALSYNNEAEMFVTMFLGILDTVSGEMTYCNAGHNAPYLFSADEECWKLPVRPKLPLGLFGNVCYVEERYQLKKGQTLLLYTDGLTEAENGQKEQMGTERVEHILGGLGECTAHEVLLGIRQQLDQFVAGAEQSDDLTLFAISYKGCKTLIIDNKLEELKKLPPFIHELEEEYGLSKPVVMSIRLALEEAMVNVINYAYPGRETGRINLKALYKPQERCIRFELTDSGKPFDPTQVEDADLSLGVEDRPVGGLGIFLIRRRMDKMTYKRENGMNKLMMTKFLDTPNQKSV